MEASAPAGPTRTGTKPTPHGSGIVSNTSCPTCDAPLSPQRIGFLTKREVPSGEWECRACHKRGKKSSKRSRNAHSQEGVPSAPPSTSGRSQPPPVMDCPKCNGGMEWSGDGLPDMYWICDGCKRDADEGEWRWRCSSCPHDLCSTCMPQPIVTGTVKLAQACPAPAAPLPRVPDKPPGAGWKEYVDEDLQWWYYKGEYGEWWYSEETGVEPYTQDDRDALKSNIRDKLLPAIEKLQPGRSRHITDRLLELEIDKLSKMLNSEAELQARVEQYISAPLRVGSRIDGTVKSISADTAFVDVCSFADARLKLQQGFAPAIGDRIEDITIEAALCRLEIVVSLKDPVYTVEVKTEAPDPGTSTKEAESDRVSKRLPRDLSPDALPPGRPASQHPSPDPEAGDRKRTRREPPRSTGDHSRFPKCAQCRNVISAIRVRQLESTSIPLNEWRCLVCSGKNANWAPALPREAAPSSGNFYGVDGNNNHVSLDGYWNSNAYPLLLWRIAGHVANRAGGHYCLLCPYGSRAEKFCYFSPGDNSHVAVGELIVSRRPSAPDSIKWDDGEEWFRRGGMPSAFIVGDRWSGDPAQLPPLTSHDTEWIRQPAQACYNSFVMYKLCSVCRSSSSGNSSVSSCTPASEALPPWRM